MSELLTVEAKMEENIGPENVRDMSSVVPTHSQVKTSHKYVGYFIIWQFQVKILTCENNISTICQTWLLLVTGMNKNC